MAVTNGYTLPPQHQTNIPVRVTRLEAYVRKLQNSAEVKQSINSFIQEFDAGNGLYFEDNKVYLGGSLEEDTVINLNGYSFGLLNTTAEAGFVIDGFTAAGLGLFIDGETKGSVSFDANTNRMLISALANEMRISSEYGVLFANFLLTLWGDTHIIDFEPGNTPCIGCGEITANKEMTFPGVTEPYAGRWLYVYVFNESAFDWTTNINYKRNDGTESNELLNGHFYAFMSNGFHWICTNKQA